MVSLWGSKNGEERSEGEERDHSREPPRRSGGAQPDERTQLLPPRRDGYLDPDDPAVCVGYISLCRGTALTR